MTNPYLKNNEWYFHAEEYSEYGPYDSEEQARNNLTRYCCIMLTHCKEWPTCNHTTITNEQYIQLRKDINKVLTAVKTEHWGMDKCMAFRRLENFISKPFEGETNDNK